MERLDQIASIIRGITIREQRDLENTKLLYIIRSSDLIRIPDIFIYNNGKIFKNKLKTAHLSLGYHQEEHYLKNGDILIPKYVGEEIDTYHVFFVTGLDKDKKYAAHSELFRIRANENKVLPEYLYYILSSKVVRETLIKIGKKDKSKRGIYNITISLLKTLKIEVPSLEIQREFVYNMKKINQEKIQLLKYIDNKATSYLLEEEE